MRTGQNCTEKKLHKGTKLRGAKIAQKYFCTKTNFHKGTKLHERTDLHEDSFALRVNFGRVTILHKSKKKLFKIN